jgi:hypothetical protein
MASTQQMPVHNRVPAEAQSMMAIDEIVTAGNQKDEELVQPPPRPTERDDAHAGKGSCQRACSLDECSCEGFRKFIG